MVDSNQKSVVRQLKQMDLCLASFRRQTKVQLFQRSYHRMICVFEATRICAGRLFHARAAAAGKARSPKVTRRVDGTSSIVVVVSAERRWRRHLTFVAYIDWDGACWLIGDGSAGLAQGCRCALPLQATGAYRGAASHTTC